MGAGRGHRPALSRTEEQGARRRAQLERREPFSDFEMHRRAANGRSVWLSISGEPMFGAGGRFVGYRGVGRDITDKVLAEQALRQTERRFRAAIDATADGIHILDHETMRFIDVNETACRYLGYTREEFLRLRIEDFSPGVDSAALKRAYEELFAAPELAQRAEIVHRRKDGALIPIEIHRRGVVIDGHRLVVNVVRDIAERKREEEVLRASEERFRTLTALYTDWYWEQDTEFRFTRFDGRMADLESRHANDVLG